MPRQRNRVIRDNKFIKSTYESDATFCHLEHHGDNNDYSSEKVAIVKIRQHSRNSAQHEYDVENVSYAQMPVTGIVGWFAVHTFCFVVAFHNCFFINTKPPSTGCMYSVLSGFTINRMQIYKIMHY